MGWCERVRECVCMRVCACGRACRRDLFAIYDHNISPRLIMIIIKIIFLYFIEIAHTDHFPSADTRLVIDKRMGRLEPNPTFTFKWTCTPTLPHEPCMHMLTKTLAHGYTTHDRARTLSRKLLTYVFIRLCPDATTSPHFNICLIVWFFR